MPPKIRALVYLLGLVIVGLSSIGYIVFLVFFDEEPLKVDKITFERATFADLTNWTADDLSAFLPSMQRSCKKILSLPNTRKMGPKNIAGTVADWKSVCELTTDLPSENDNIRSFIEANFTPIAIGNNTKRDGLYTGYYEASLNGSVSKTETHKYPLHLRPEELIMVDLGQFREDLKGRRIAGKVVNGKLKPYPERSAIDKGALDDRDLELVWVDSEVDAFFLQIQGSGIVDMQDGSTLRVGYAGQNGHPYFAIGKELIKNGGVPREKMSMQAIRDWLEGNPDKARDVMHLNKSYVFFRKLKGAGPIGAQNVALTPERSLAVDRKWLPLGVPIWLEAAVPAEKDGDPDLPFAKLLMAQDTGGAIRGPVRGDVFWGHGKRAYEIAGRMKAKGKAWILLPNAVADRLLNDNSS